MFNNLQSWNGRRSFLGTGRREDLYVSVKTDTADLRCIKRGHTVSVSRACIRYFTRSRRELRLNLYNNLVSPQDAWNTSVEVHTLGWYFFGQGRQLFCGPEILSKQDVLAMVFIESIFELASIVLLYFLCSPSYSLLQYNFGPAACTKHGL